MWSAHVGALLVDSVLPLMGWPRIGLAALIGVSLWWQERFGILARTGEIRLDNDSWVLTSKGEAQRYRIVQASIHPGFIRFYLRDIHQRSRLQLVASDSVDPETYRVLRARIAQRRFSSVEPV